MKKTLFLICFITSLGISVITHAAFPGYPVTPDPADFGTVRVGQSSAPQTLTMKNLYAVPVTVQQVAVVDNTNFLIVNNGCDKAILDPNGTCKFDVIFAPKSSGHFISSTALQTYGPLTPGLSTIEGNGVEPVVEFSPSSLDFGDQTVGKSSNSMFVGLINIGTADLTFSNVTVDPPFSITNNSCTGAMPPNFACAVFVTFTPTAEGPVSGNLTFTDDASDSPQTVPLTGNGVTAPQPHASLSRTEIDFGGQLVGSTSAAIDVTLKNTGTEVLNISDIAITGDFGLTHDCGATLAVNALCTLSITFSPTAEGTATGEVMITDDSTQSPQTIILSGFGTIHNGPKASLSANTIDFGYVLFNTLSDILTYSLQNLGDEDLVISDIAITGKDTSYFYTENDCLKTLIPGESCSGQVIFFPFLFTRQECESLDLPKEFCEQETVDVTPFELIYSALIEFSDNSSDSPQQITLMGTGVIAIPDGSGCQLVGNIPLNSGSIISLLALLSFSIGLISVRHYCSGKR